MILLLAGSCYALEIPTEYANDIREIHFYPNGAKFTFHVDPADKEGNFTAILPGAFLADSVKLLNPDEVYGDIRVVSYPRTKWIPKQLEALKAQHDEQSRKVDTLKAQQEALEQTLELLGEAKPDKSNTADLMTYIKDAQKLRLDTESELAALKVTIAQEQERLRMLANELKARTPRNDTTYIAVTGQAGGTVELEAFTNAASWSPRYTLDLDTDDGEIEVHMYVRASQHTGLNYEGDMVLHTKTPDENITTPTLNPLRVGIKPKREEVGAMGGVRLSRTNAQYTSAKMAMSEMAMEDTAVEEAEEDVVLTAPKRPAVRETLADRTLDIDGLITGDGVEKEFEVIMSDLTLESKPIIVLIPELRNNAWIIASMDANNEHLIPGEAELRVAHYPSGKIFLQEYGAGQKEIPFGYAEQITVKKEALIGKTGVSWFSGVSTNGYKLEITNGTKTDKTITVRDRLPIPTDDKIKLDVKGITPKEKERDRNNILTWEVEVPAGATVPITVDYTLSYPSGEELQYR